MIGRAARDCRKMKPAKAAADSSPSQMAENSRMRLNAISIVTRPSASAMPPGMSNGSRAARGCDAGRPRNSNSATIAIGMRNQNTAGQSQVATSAPPSSGPSIRPSAIIMV